MFKQRRRLELAEGDFAQMENGQACGQILVVGGVGGNQIRRRLNDGFVNVVGADAVVKLNVRFQLHLRHRYIIQPCCGPGDNTVDFIQVNLFQTPIAFGHFQMGGGVHGQQISVW